MTAARPDDDDIAKWCKVFEMLIERTVDPMPDRRDPGVRRAVQRVGAEPFSRAAWQQLLSVTGAMRGSTGQVAWDDMASVVRDGVRTAERLAEIRRAHAPYCDGDKGAMTRAGDSWRCADVATCTARHWGFDATELDDRYARRATPCP